MGRSSPPRHVAVAWACRQRPGSSPTAARQQPLESAPAPARLARLTRLARPGLELRRTDRIARSPSHRKAQLNEVHWPPVMVSNWPTPRLLSNLSTSCRQNITLLILSKTPLYPVDTCPQAPGFEHRGNIAIGPKGTGVDSRSAVWTSGWQNWRPPARKGSRLGRGFLSAEISFDSFI